MITVSPDNIKQFGSMPGRDFYLMVTPELLPHIKLKAAKHYSKTEIVVFDPAKDTINEFIANHFPNHVDILFIPYGIENRPFGHKKYINETQRLLTFVCHSAPIDLDQLAHFLKLLEKTDPAKQIQLAEAWYKKINGNKQLHFINQQYHTQATLTIKPGYLWGDIYGYVPEGGHHMALNGEIALTPMVSPAEVDRSLTDIPKLDITGSLIFHGYSMLHRSVAKPYVSLADQARLFTALDSLRDHPIKLALTGGMITSLEPLSNGAKQAVNVLESLFMIDSRYQMLFEIGFGLNTHLELYPGNCTLNESFGAKAGCLHFGIGSRLTNYHYDIICPGTKVITEKNDLLFSVDDSLLNRQDAMTCPCL